MHSGMLAGKLASMRGDTPMDFTQAIDGLGEHGVALAGGIIVGALFGAFAQQSRFCLRAAAVDFARGQVTSRVAVWLMAFSAAVIGTQVLVLTDIISVSEARQLASPQSLTGAALGGLMFGCGMVLANGCASRLLVLSATGNLRALLSGLVFAVVAQASLHGILSPLRGWLAGLVTTNAIGGNDLLTLTGFPAWPAFILLLVWLFAGIVYAVRGRAGWWISIAAIGAGLAIPAGWWFTANLAGQVFDPIKVESLTFTGPSADNLMLFLDPAGQALDFGIGLVPGVFIGSFLAALVTHELKLQGFHDGPSMRRYLTGAALMGFGGMLAGGCAVGAGVTGASVFALTAWITLTCIWLAAAATDALIDRAPLEPAASDQAIAPAE